MARILTAVLMGYLTLTLAQPAAACMTYKGRSAKDLSEAKVLVRATLTKYEILEPRLKARLTLEIVESVFGARREGELVAIWENPMGSLEDVWNGSTDLLVALKSLKPRKDGAMYEIIHPLCSPPSIMEFNAVNTWILSQDFYDR